MSPQNKKTKKRKRNKVTVVKLKDLREKKNPRAGKAEPLSASLMGHLSGFPSGLK